MMYYVLAQCEQAIGRYPKAEAHLLYAIRILPERIYPYYLLALLYAEPACYHPEKLSAAIDTVLHKKPKVESTAIREMREKVGFHGSLFNSINKNCVIREICA